MYYIMILCTVLYAIDTNLALYDEVKQYLPQFFPPPPPREAIYH